MSNFEVEANDASGGIGGVGGTGGGGAAGMGSAGAGGSAGGISRISQPRLVDDHYVMLQGTSLSRDASQGLLANDTPVSLRVNGFTNLDPTRPRQFDADMMVAPDGSFHFTPPARFFGSYSFTYTAENLVGQSASASVEIRVIPVEIDLDAVIQGIGGYILYGASGERLGASLDRANDVNADGFADLLIGAPDANAGDGAAFVVFGKQSLDSIDVEPLTVGSKEQRFACVLGGTGAGLGAAVAGLGDVDRDGHADFAAAATSGNGRAYFAFGAELATIGSFPFGGAYSIEGDSANVAAAGLLRGGGDIDGDGVPDALFSSMNGDTGWLHFPYGGRPLSGALRITDAPGAHVRAASASDGFPLDAAFVGDLDGDGADEVLAASDSAFYLFRGGLALPVDAAATSVGGTAGGFRAARALPGAASVAGLGDINADGVRDLAFCDGTQVCSILLGPVSTLAQTTLVSGFRRNTRRTSVRGSGDVDGDGLDDILFSDDQRAYLVYGDRAGPAPLDVSKLSAAGFSVRAAAGGGITAALVAGDVNHDGLDDLALADSAADGGAGRVYVVFGIPSR